MPSPIDLTIPITAPMACHHSGCRTPAAFIAVEYGTTTSIYACADHLGHVLPAGREYAVLDLATIDARIPPTAWRSKSISGVAS